jgi:hypothetical protein
VRILLVDQVPLPPAALLQAASDEAALLPETPSGLTVQYGIFIRRDRQSDRHLLAHELAHTAQYERLGGIVPFLRDYLTECVTFGYSNAPLEQEAEESAGRITRTAVETAEV